MKAGQQSPLDVWHLTVGLGRGGVERLLVGILPEMRHLGIRPRVLVLKGWGPVGDDLRAAGVPVDVLHGTGGVDPRPVWRLMGRLRSGRPDVLHAHLSRAVMAGTWAARWSGTPVIAHFHSLVGPRPAWQDRLESRACRRAVALLAVSRAVAQDRVERLKLCAEAFRVIPNGIDTASLADIPEPAVAPENPLVAGFMGRLLERTKGIDVLLQAAEHIQGAVGADRLRFQIAGGPPEAARRLQRSVARRQLGAMVDVLGEVAEPGGALRRWDLLVLPSRQEGFGLVLLEAMAAGRAVVATSQGGIPEVVDDGKTGLLVPPGDPVALAEALLALEQERERVIRLGRAARQSVQERFPSHRTAAAWAEIARTVAAGREAA